LSPTFPLKEKYISIAGYKIRFKEQGNGHPLILLHGLGSSLEWWDYNIEALSQKYRVIALDFPGFGLSSKSEVKLSLDFTSRFMESFLDAFHLPQASLIGNSMGGLIALYTALRIPERIERLILVDPAGFGPNLSVLMRAGALYPVGELALALRNRIFVRFYLSRMFYDRKKVPSSLIDTVLRIFSLPKSQKVCLQVLRYGVNLRGLREKIWLPVVEKASSLYHKTLIIWGAEDRIVPLNQAYLGERLIKNSRLHVFERCGHIPQVEYPVKFNRVVFSFLESEK